MRFSRLYLGSDHGGLEKKRQIINYLKEQGIDYEDIGPFEYDASDDYVDFAIKVAKKVQKDPEAKGVILCKSGIGMYQVANKFRDIRAAEVRSVKEAETDVHHHNSNVLVLGGLIDTEDSSEDILKAWLDAEFEKNGRHHRRIKKMKLVEYENIKYYPTHPRIVPAVLFDQAKQYLSYTNRVSKFSSRIHIDIMDGEYVDNTSPSALTIAKELESVNAFLAFHLMIKAPNDDLLNQLSNYKNINVVYIHAEEFDPKLLENEYSFDLAIAIRPEIDINKYVDVINKAKIVLLLPIIPGFYGAEFMPKELEKISEIREMGSDKEIHIDGSVNHDTLKTMLNVEPDILNVGSAIAKKDSPAKAYSELVQKVSNASRI